MGKKLLLILLFGVFFNTAFATRTYEQTITAKDYASDLQPVKIATPETVISPPSSDTDASLEGKEAVTVKTVREKPQETAKSEPKKPEVKADFKALIVFQKTVKKDSKEKIIFLTVDDAWDKKIVQKSVDYLVDKKIKATFFPTGSAIKANPDIWKKAIEAGSEIGNHTYNHSQAQNVGEEKYEADIIKWDKTAKDLLDYEARWFRPPGLGGFTSKALKARFIPVVESTGHDIAIWSDLTDTYYHLYRLGKGKTAKEVSDYVVSVAKPGNIILLHFNKMDMAALPGIVDGLLAKGYVFKTLSEGWPKEVEENGKSD